MARSLVMTFVNIGGKKSNITLNNVKEDLTAEEVNKAMDVVIDKNVFQSKDGDLVSKDSAKIVDRTTREIDLA
ncbi:DUF2922 domain-containing protein [uncultured Clostridium sp.]|uniref:DUF2922 domain-containing protein n=1 Tax=uncultured Clostridium sp. TaxID=59620 RepID=UPI0028ECAA67|nr:DUF2922 domain-containing protein [uncultured Clostridium sp.]